MAGFGFLRTREWLPGLAREIHASPEKNPCGIYIGAAVHRPRGLTGRRRGVSAAPVSRSQVVLEPAHPRVVGSFGKADCLADSRRPEVAAACDLVEVRLDLLGTGSDPAGPRPWSHLGEIPLLFTARRGDEGGAGDLNPRQRMDMLDPLLEEAALVDIELVSAPEMAATLARMRALGVPWIASWHDFEGRADSFARIPAMAEQAARAGAACFKAAVRLHAADDIERLTDLFARVDALPLSLMGMGPLAKESRLRCAAAGSVLNYGYLGDAPTAPGQCSAAELKAGIAAARP
jgi:3-dehydroquinate dehydratase type I